VEKEELRGGKLQIAISMLAKFCRILILLLPSSLFHFLLIQQTNSNILSVY